MSTFVKKARTSQNNSENGRTLWKLIGVNEVKLAVVDHFGNVGGGSRFIRSLLLGLRKRRPQVEITFFCNQKAIDREGFARELFTAGIEIRALRSVLLNGIQPFGIHAVGRFIQILQQKYSRKTLLLPHFLSGAVHREVEKVTRGFDLTYFPWPYLVCCPQLNCPMVGTFHDFNFKYYFSGPSFGREALELLDREIPLWLEAAHPIVSTHFMKEEIAKFYPQFSHKVSVVHLSPMSTLSNISQESADKFVREMGIYQDYIIYPCQLATHKNVGNLIVAHSILKKRGHHILLILTGQNTEIVRGRSCSIGLERGISPPDVIGQGYVTNLQMDALIQCAKVVVTPSLYEAGNGPGLDAWCKKTPVAMSNISPFVEHLQQLNVKAAVFDPLSPLDIADKIESIIKNPAVASADAQHSQQAIGKYSWEHVAGRYFEVFDQALEGRRL